MIYCERHSLGDLWYVTLLTYYSTAPCLHSKIKMVSPFAQKTQNSLKIRFDAKPYMQKCKWTMLQRGEGYFPCLASCVEWAQNTHCQVSAPWQTINNTCHWTSPNKGLQCHMPAWCSLLLMPFSFSPAGSRQSKYPQYCVHLTMDDFSPLRHLGIQQSQANHPWQFGDWLEQKSWKGGRKRWVI